MTIAEVRTEVAGKVWKINKSIGERVAADEPVVILESMKMEIPILATTAGTIIFLRVSTGDHVQSGKIIAILQT